MTFILAISYWFHMDLRFGLNAGTRHICRTVKYEQNIIDIILK